MCVLVGLSLSSLPDEILLHILTFLSIPDLLQLSRTCVSFRRLTTDPLLHQERLKNASHQLASALARRPSRSSISPPNAWIWLSRTYVLSRSINRSLIRIRLSHSLEHRPTSRDLVDRAILPSSSMNVSPVIVRHQQAVYKKRLAENLERKLERRPSVENLVSLNIIPGDYANNSMSPMIFQQRRKVIRESLKDGLRGWVGSRGIQAQKQRAAELEEAQRLTVKDMVRRFAALKAIHDIENDINRDLGGHRRSQAKWGRALELQRTKDEKRAIWGGFACPYPTRARVLGLRRFYESVIRSARE